MKMIFVIAALFLFQTQVSAKNSVQYEVISETSDSPSHTYTLKFQVWSSDPDSEQIRISIKSQGKKDEKKLQIETPMPMVIKGFHGFDKKVVREIRVKNSTTETLTLQIVLQDKAKSRTDKKTVSIQVAPQ